MSKLSRIFGLSRRRALEGHLGVVRQLGEMVALRLLHGVGPTYYHMAGFWRRDLAWRDKTRHLSAREYKLRIGVLNPLQYRKLSQNKIPEKAILALFGIPTSRFLGRLNLHSGCEPSGRLLRGATDLERLAREQSASRLVFKPLEGWGGKGVHVPQVFLSNGVTFREAGRQEAFSAEEYCREVLELENDTDWLLEEFFHQHAVLAGLNPTSVNTVRIWVLDLGQGEYRVLLALVRIGRAGMVVDNTSSGGIAAPIDLASGRVGPARGMGPDYEAYGRHPDHGAPIDGILLPHWKEVCDLATRALAIFPGLRFAGLDIAIGPDGPVVQELNVSPDREHAAVTDSPTALLLKP